MNSEFVASPGSPAFFLTDTPRQTLRASREHCLEPRDRQPPLWWPRWANPRSSWLGLAQAGRGEQLPRSAQPHLPCTEPR